MEKVPPPNKGPPSQCHGEPLVLEICLPPSPPYSSIDGIRHPRPLLDLKIESISILGTNHLQESQPHSSPQVGLHFKITLPRWPGKPQAKNSKWSQVGCAPRQK